MRDEFRDDLSGNAKLVDDLDALTSWAKRSGFNEDDPESSVVVIPRSGNSEAFGLPLVIIISDLKILYNTIAKLEARVEVLEEDLQAGELVVTD